VFPLFAGNPPEATFDISNPKEITDPILKKPNPIRKKANPVRRKTKVRVENPNPKKPINVLRRNQIQS